MLPDIRQADVAGKRVLVRFDGDVPVDKQNGTILDDYRVALALPTIRSILDRGGKVVLLASRGRPGGKPDPALSIKVLADYLTRALGEPVEFITELLAPKVSQRVALLENLRFYPGEETNETAFARLLAAFGDMYVNESFAVSHRMHASFDALPKRLPHYAGIQLQSEVSQLTPLQHDAEQPYMLVLGGAKANDKSPVIAQLLDTVDTVLLGGLVAVTYMAAMGQPTGAHELDDQQVSIARQTICRMSEHDIPLLVPVDIINQEQQVKRVTNMIATDLMIDIGPETNALFAKELDRANTIFWNGAMGKAEDPAFAIGTIAVARAIGQSGAEVRIASGGDTVGVIHSHHLENNFTFLSTGGGATLEFLAGAQLPGIQSLLL